MVEMLSGMEIRLRRCPHEGPQSASVAHWNATNDWVLTSKAESSGTLTATAEGLRLDCRLGGERCDLLAYPDRDLRYRKTVTVNGTPATGPFASATLEFENIWLDGIGQMACAYAACGDREKSWLYANQYDPFLMDVTLGGVRTRTLPCTANAQGGFDFDQSQGFLSPVVWYLFAKNGFNPMALSRAE